MRNKEVISLIEFLIKKTDVCASCEKLGQELPKCTCMSDKECAKHILELWEAR